MLIAYLWQRLVIPFHPLIPNSPISSPNSLSSKTHRLKLPRYTYYRVRRSLWSYSKFDKPWAEGSYQPYRGGGTDVVVSMTAGPMLTVWGLKSQQPALLIHFSFFGVGGGSKASLFRPLLCCHLITVCVWRVCVCTLVCMCKCMMIDSVCFCGVWCMGLWK